MVAVPTPVEIFCCYAREDEAWLHKLETHLSLLKRQGLISLWYDRLIAPGTGWAKAIDTHLETASVILLLVSSDFFSSDYCYGIEMKRALEREAAGEARVIPILMRPVDWKCAPFAHLQVLPTDAKPIASWQNKDTALADVAAGIRRVIVEELPQLTATAPRAALPAIWNIPYPRNPFFLGRESELLRIHQNLQTGQATALSQPQAISGLGGIGKTQLALEYAYRYHQDYTAVLWARAESTDALISSYVALATLLRLPEREAKEQKATVQAVKTWLQTHRTWLLILDNADELALLPNFLPPSLGGHLLLTTRATATGRLAHRLEIETLEPTQGALLLLRRAGLIVPDAELLQAAQEERDLALRISQELGGLPLAVDQAAAYLEETGIGLDSYWQIYQQHRADLLRERRGLVADHPDPIATTWSLSFQLVEEKSPAAADLMRLCAYLSPDAIPEEILTADASSLGSVLASVAADAFRLNQAIEALRAYSLVRRDPREKTLSIHRLVQAVVQDSLSESEQAIWIERVIAALKAAFPKGVHPAWSVYERLLPHVLICATHPQSLKNPSLDLASLLFKAAGYLNGRAQYRSAEPLYREALRIREQALGSEHPDMVYPLIRLAECYKEQDKLEEAEELYQRALPIRERIPGLERPDDLATLLNNLASLYAELGKDAEAEELYQRVLQIREQQLSPGHPDLIIPLNNLASFYTDQGKYAEAERLYQQSLEIREQELGPQSPRVDTPLKDLAGCYMEQGKYAEAEPLYQRVLQIWEQKEILDSEHPGLADPLIDLAECYIEQGKYAEAEPLYQRILRILEQALGPEHPQMVYPLNNLATLYSNQGKYVEADALYQRARRISEQTLGTEHPETAESMHGLARLREVQGSSEESRVWYARALAIREQALGKHHPQTTETRSCLIALLHALGQHEEAAQLEAV